VSAFAYDGALRELVARAKYRGARTGWAWLAEALARTVAEAEGAPTLQAVTWPPTTSARRRQRGFDQAEWLARRVAEELALPARRLLRRHPGPAQTGRDRRARAEHGPVFAAHPAAQGARLLVVDDVATTGATLASAAAALRAGGAVTVAAATAARTPHPGARGKNYQGGLKAPLRGADF
jgi:predicted amidophosphoribosyltransferase